MASVLHGGRYLEVYTASLNGTIGTSPVLTLGDQIKTDVSLNYTEGHEITVEHIKSDAALMSFIQTYVEAQAGTDVEQIVYEDGSKSTTANVANPLLVIVKGGLSGSGSGAPRKIFTALAYLDPTSGSWSQEGNKYERPSLKFKTIEPSAVVTVPATYYTNFAVTPAQVTFGQGNFKYGRVHFA